MKSELKTILERKISNGKSKPAANISYPSSAAAVVFGVHLFAHAAY
jgi:hypothetical protein